MKEERNNLHEKIKAFSEVGDQFWISPLILANQVGDSQSEEEDKRLGWQFSVKKDDFFSKKLFLRVLVEEKGFWFEERENENLENKKDEMKFFNFPRSTLAVVRSFTREVKRII